MSERAQHVVPILPLLEENEITCSAWQRPCPQLRRPSIQYLNLPWVSSYIQLTRYQDPNIENHLQSCSIAPSVDMGSSCFSGSEYSQQWGQCRKSICRRVGGSFTDCRKRDAILNKEHTTVVRFRSSHP